MTVKWNGQKVHRAFRNGSEAGIGKSLDHVLADSLRLVPLEYGELQASGRVENRGYSGHIEYGGPPCEDPIIAIVQHEDLDMRHKAGRSAKYVEIPLLTNADKVHMTIGHELRQRLGGDNA